MHPPLPPIDPASPTLAALPPPRDIRTSQSPMSHRTSANLPAGIAALQPPPIPHAHSHVSRAASPVFHPVFPPPHSRVPAHHMQHPPPASHNPPRALPLLPARADNASRSPSCAVAPAEPAPGYAGVHIAAQDVRKERGVMYAACAPPVNTSAPSLHPVREDATHGSTPPRQTSVQHILPAHTAPPHPSTSVAPVLQAAHTPPRLGAQGAAETGQTGSTFARLRPPKPRDAMADSYWKRLHRLLVEAAESSLALRGSFFGGGGKEGDGGDENVARRVACDLQGLRHAQANDILASREGDSRYIDTYVSRAAGAFVSYGIADEHANWVAACLADVEASREKPENGVGIVDGMEGHPDGAVEDVRVRVFEAEISCMPVVVGTELIDVRKIMRRTKQRVDLCVKILMALNGLRRCTQASLEKMKLQLEKADLTACVDRERVVAKKEKERVKSEKAKSIGKSGGKTKRKRQLNAAATFMKRFVKAKEMDEARDLPGLPLPEGRDGVVAPVADDREVMSVAWWLRSEMDVLPSEMVESGMRGDGNAKDLNSVLQFCASRRSIAEGRVPDALGEYRRARKVNVEDRTPRFVKRRAQVRGRGKNGAVKLLQFDENNRPAYYGTYGKRSRTVRGRRPLAKEAGLDYEADSDDEWEEEGEDLCDVEAEKDMALEDAELKRLYGSDDEEDDDFLDDGDAEDEDDEGEDEDGDADGDDNSPANQEAGEGAKPGEGAKREDGGVVDLTMVTVKSPVKNGKRAGRDENGKKVKRRRTLRQVVVIHHASVANTDPTRLDKHPVTIFEDAQPIQMFNPFVYNTSDIAAEHLKAKPPTVRVTRPSTMDDNAKLDLALTLKSGISSKDRIVLQFCEQRKTRGLRVPSKSEILRAIDEIGTREKRDGDTRAGWYLNDPRLALKLESRDSGVQCMPTVVSASASVVKAE